MTLSFYIILAGLFLFGTSAHLFEKWRYAVQMGAVGILLTLAGMLLGVVSVVMEVLS